MRHPRVLVLLVAVASPLLHFACTDSDETPPNTSFDSGIPSTDGSVSADGQVLPDVVIPADAQIDAGALPVTVRALSKGTPVPGVTIVWGDASGAVVDTSTTDASGLAQKVVASGSMVTAILGTAEMPRLVTVLAVEPGDVLTAVDSTEDGDNGPGTLSIEAIPGNPPAGLTGYTTRTGQNCSGFINAAGTLPASVGAYNTCQHAGRANLLITAEQSSTPLAFTHKKGIALSPDGGDTPVSVDGGTWNPLGSHRITVLNPQTDAGAAYVISAEWASGVKISETDTLDTTDGGTQSANIVAHPGFADTTVAEVHYSVFNGPNQSHRGVASKAGADGGTTLDFASALPFIRTVQADGGADAGPRTVTWSADSPLTTADGAFVRIAWYENFADGGFVNGAWTVVMPPNATSVTFPSLPAAHAARGPSATASVNGSPVVVFFESPALNGYGDVRKASAALPPTYDLVNGNDYYGLMPELPVDGIVNFTVITDNGD